MILSHKHKYIFIKSFKTASTSLEIALSKFCDKEDIITPLKNEDEIIRKNKGYNGPQNYNDKLVFHEHMPASEIKSKINLDIWSKYFKFTVVRNPFNQIVSAFYWHNKSKENERKFLFFKKRKKSFEVFFKIKAHHIFEDEYLRYTKNDEILVDKFIKFENFEEDLALLNKKLNFSEDIYKVFKSIRAKSNIRPIYPDSYSDLINEDINKKIAKLADKIIRLHKY